MRNQPKQLLPLFHAIEEAESVVRKLTAVSESLLEAVEYGYPLELTEQEIELIQIAKVSGQTSAKYLADFEGALADESSDD